MEHEPSNNRQDIIALTPSEIANRRRLRWVLSKFFRTRIATGRENLEEAAEFVEREGVGLSIKINHFSRSDPLQAMLAATMHPTLADRRIVAPIAAHQTLPKWVKFVERSRLVGVELFPVVTKNTIERAMKKGNTEGLSLGQGSMQYMSRAAEVLMQGGIELSAPQGERQAYLEPFDGRPFATFVQMMRRKKVNNFGVLFLGFDLEGVDNYYDVRGLNVCREYSVNFGKFFSRDSMVEAVGGKIEDLELWAWGQLASVSSPSYVNRRR